MKKIAKVLSLVMVAVMVITVFAACGKKDKNNNVVNAEFTEYLVAEKIGTVNRDDYFTSDAGLEYKGDNGLWGVISYNGAYDTGAVFTHVSSHGEYFQVRKKEPTKVADVAALNSSYLIDCKGNIVIPSGYAAFQILSDRYIMVAKAIKQTVSEKKALIRDADNGLYQLGGYADGVWYEGEWFVYDLITEKLVPGVKGTEYKTVMANGRYLQYDLDDGNYASFDENGDELSADAKLFDDGSYCIEGKTGEMFDETGKSLFKYDLAGFIPSSVSGDYYVASKYADGASTYVVMDKNGEVISSEFNEFISIYGDIIESEGKLYNLKGESIIDGTYESVYFDDVVEQNWIIRNDKTYTMIDKNGSVFFNGTEDKKSYVSTTEFLFSKEIDGEKLYYNHKTQDYTIKGQTFFAPWVVKTETANDMFDLVDTMTGKKLIEGYSDYDCITRDSAYYIYAEYNGGADVYLIVSSAQLEDVLKRKNSLFDDLIKAFEAEGITATVNKETGEIALDSSVLFGGDSAELTADGKAFLNKFIKAYTSVVFSEEYDGFISKTIVEGHTAPVEGTSYADDIQLSEDRANNVMSYCFSEESGMNSPEIAKTFESVGYSNSKPVYNDDGSVNMAASRRVSFRFMVNVEF